MSWDREGQYVTANHQGARLSGTITHSRVKYGGAIQHTIELDLFSILQHPGFMQRLVSEDSIVQMEAV